VSTSNPRSMAFRVDFIGSQHVSATAITDPTHVASYPSSLKDSSIPTKQKGVGTNIDYADINLATTKAAHRSWETLTGTFHALRKGLMLAPRPNSSATSSMAFRVATNDLRQALSLAITKTERDTTYPSSYTSNGVQEL
jgi:hypothetical protein